MLKKKNRLLQSLPTGRTPFPSFNGVAHNNTSLEHKRTLNFPIRGDTEEQQGVSIVTGFPSHEKQTSLTVLVAADVRSSFTLPKWSCMVGEKKTPPNQTLCPALPLPSEKTQRQALPAADSFLGAEVMLDLPFCSNNQKEKSKQFLWQNSLTTIFCNTFTLTAE